MSSVDSKNDPVRPGENPLFRVGKMLFGVFCGAAVGALVGGFAGGLGLAVVMVVLRGEFCGSLWWAAWLGPLPGGNAGSIGGGVGGGIAELTGKIANGRECGAILGLVTAGIAWMVYGFLPVWIADGWLPGRGGVAVAMAAGGLVGGWVGGNGWLRARDRRYSLSDLTNSEP